MIDDEDIPAQPQDLRALARPLQLENDVVLPYQFRFGEHLRVFDRQTNQLLHQGPVSMLRLRPEYIYGDNQWDVAYKMVQIAPMIAVNAPLQPLQSVDAFTDLEQQRVEVWVEYGSALDPEATVADVDSKLLLQQLTPGDQIELSAPSETIRGIVVSNRERSLQVDTAAGLVELYTWIGGLARQKIAEVKVRAWLQKVK